MDNENTEKNNPLAGTSMHGGSIYQANELIEAQMSMSINELRLMHLSLLKTTPQLKKITEKDVTFPLTTINPDQVVKIFGSGTSAYNKIKLAASKLSKKQINIEDKETHEFVFRNMYSSIGFSAKQGGLKFRFAEDMKPYVYYLSENFTKIAGELSFLLESPFSVRLIQWMLRLQGLEKFKSTIIRTMTVDSIRAQLLLDGRKYERQNDFMNRVIKVAVDDINRSTGYRIEYEEIRQGKKIHSIKFFLHLPESLKEIHQEIEEMLPARMKAIEDRKDKSMDVDNIEAPIVEVLKRYGVGKTVAKKLAEEYDVERIRNNIRYSLEQKKIKNLGGYIAKAIRDDYYHNKDVRRDEGKVEAELMLGAKSKRQKAEEYLLDLGLSDPECAIVLYDMTQQTQRLTRQSEEILNDHNIDGVSFQQMWRTDSFGGTVIPEDTSVQYHTDIKTPPVVAELDTASNVSTQKNENSNDEKIKKFMGRLVEAMFKGKKLTISELSEFVAVGINVEDLAKKQGRSIEDLLE